MNKYLAAFLVVLITSSAANAQYATSSTYIGIRAGANFSGQSLDSTVDNATTGFKFGISGGLQIDHWFDDMWGIGVGLLFNQKGTHEEYSQGKIANQVLDSTGVLLANYTGPDDYTLSYLEIPIILKAAFGDGDVKPYVFVGPSIGILLSASNTSNAPFPAITDIKSALNSTDISIYFGGGFSDHLYSGQMLFFEAGYSAGLTKVYKSIPPERMPRNATTNPNGVPHPINHEGSKSGDIRLSLGMMWPI